MARWEQGSLFAWRRFQPRVSPVVGVRISGRWTVTEGAVVRGGLAECSGPVGRACAGRGSQIYHLELQKRDIIPPTDRVLAVGSGIPGDLPGGG